MTLTHDKSLRPRGHNHSLPVVVTYPSSVPRRLYNYIQLRVFTSRRCTGIFVSILFRSDLRLCSRLNDYFTSVLTARIRLLCDLIINERMNSSSKINRTVWKTAETNGWTNRQTDGRTLPNARPFRIKTRPVFATGQVSLPVPPVNSLWGLNDVAITHTEGEPVWSDRQSHSDTSPPKISRRLILTHSRTINCVPL